MENRIVLITGASSGIGKACALHLASRGFRVYGTSRAATPAQAPFTMLQADVTDPAAVHRAVDAVMAREGRIDVLVNNAGITVGGPLEGFSEEEARRQMEVNFFGAFRACREVLPIMRRQGGGYIVNIGSIGGLIAIPYQPLYSASKFALEGMSESLRQEVRGFGIRVVIIEPGDTKTPITQNRIFTADAATSQAYPVCRAAIERMAKDEQGGSGPEGIARLLDRIVNTRQPRLRYTTGPVIQRIAVWLKRLWPYAAVEFGMRKYYGLG